MLSPINYLILIFLFLMTNGEKLDKDKIKNKDWDILIFTQHWPITVCLQYEESINLGTVKEGEHVCTFPPNKDLWTIHGIWPTKYHTEGPAFCNTTNKFNVSLIDAIEKDLVIAWPNLQGDKGISSLWKHEWTKHGTCAAVLDSLNTELKYFETGLRLFNQYNITDMLNRAKIVPGDDGQADIDTIYYSLQKLLGKNPQVRCVTEKESQKPYLFEVRVCFDKNITLIDCDGIKGQMRQHYNRELTMLTNCPTNQPLYYPSQIKHAEVVLEQLDQPQIQHLWFDYANNWYLDLQFLHEVLQGIRFLQWIIL